MTDPIGSMAPPDYDGRLISRMDAYQISNVRFGLEDGGKIDGLDMIWIELDSEGVYAYPWEGGNPDYILADGLGGEIVGQYIFDNRLGGVVQVKVWTSDPGGVLNAGNVAVNVPDAGYTGG